MPDGPRATANAGAHRGAGVPRAVRAHTAAAAGAARPAAAAARAARAAARLLRVRVRLRRVCGVRGVRVLRLLPAGAVPGVTAAARSDMNLVPNVYRGLYMFDCI